MNKMWLILFFVLPIVGYSYLCWRVWHILPLTPAWRWTVVGVMVACLAVFFSNMTLGVNHLPMTLAEISYEVGNSTIFIALYAVLVFGMLDIGRALHLVSRSFLFDSMRGTLTVVLLLLTVFTYGYLNYLHKERVEMTLKSEKPLKQPLKIVFASDLHLGYHNRKAEFQRWVDLINREQPDLVLIGGDIIEGSIRAIREQKMEDDFRRIKAPIYACLGNHEFYSGIPGVRDFYRDAGIHLLVDSVVTVGDITVIGRDDRTNAGRKTLRQLVDAAPKGKYTILLDHQPYHLEEAELAGIDFQFSGHTHYGQVWPISWIEDALYEDAFGPLQKGHTRYYVSSGIGIWGAKFRIGTRSEYVVATIDR